MSGETYKNIKFTAVKNAKWALIETMLPRVVTPLITIVLARFLTPEDYGIVAVSVLVVTLVMSFQQQGIGDALIQVQGEIEDAKNACFWLSLGIGFCFSLLIFIFSPLIANLFDDMRLEMVLRIQAWQVFLSALGSTHIAILRRDFKYRQVATMGVVGSLCPVFVALPLAYMGFGYWSLVISQLSSEVLRILCVYIIFPWRPKLRFEHTKVKGIIWFGAMVTIEGLAAWFLSQGDNMILGFFNPMSVLGVYSYGYKLVMLFLGLLVAPFTSLVIYSLYCQQAGNMGELLTSVKKLSADLSFVLFPACFGMAVIADSAIPIVFGQRWAGLSSVVTILSISPGMFFILSPINSALKASGRPDILAKFNIVTIFMMIPLLAITAQYGLIPFCWGRFAIPIIFFFPKIAIAARCFKSSIYDLLKPMLPFFVIAIMMSILVRLILTVEIVIFAPTFSLVIAIITGVIFYVLAVFLYDRRVLFNFISLSIKVIWSKK